MYCYTALSLRHSSRCQTQVRFLAYHRIKPHAPPLVRAPVNSFTVPNAILGLSPRISHQAYIAAYMPFTPNNSEQRSPLTCYRGCWHVISRGLFVDYRHQMSIPSHPYSSSTKGFYNFSAFFIHAASLRQTSVHCGIFLAAASRRSLGRISVPMCPFTLSGRIPIVALVGLYLTN